jgi:hypothetical protein
LGKFSPHDPSCHDRIGIEARNEEDSNLDKPEGGWQPRELITACHDPFMEPDRINAQNAWWR